MLVCKTKLVLNKLRSEFTAQKPVCTLCRCSSLRAVRGSRHPVCLAAVCVGSECTAVHIYAYCNSAQIKPLECSLTVAELETATIILVNKMVREQLLTVLLVS